MFASRPTCVAFIVPGACVVRIVAAHKSSEVFGDAGALSPANDRNIVTLSDTEIETADVVRSFLHLATSWAVETHWKINHLERLARFLHKYECKGPMAVLVESLVNQLEYDNFSRIFFLLARLNLPCAILNCCRSMADSWEDDHEVNVKKLVPKINRRVMAHLPTDFQWALLKAVYDVGDDDKCGGWMMLHKYIKDCQDAPPTPRYQGSAKHPASKKRKTRK